MKTPPLPNDETARLAKLDGLGIIYSPAEERFDRITVLARQIFNVPIALVSLVSEKCQWFKSAQGLLAAETPREISFCGHAILSQNTLVIPDTLLNPDFADNPLVAGEPHIRFYAGQPVQFQGSNLGTLCIIDRVPRTLRPSEIETLRSLAAWVENEIKVSEFSQAQQQLLSELDEARREALVDPLTKTWNRRGLEQLFSSEIERARRENEPVSILLIDVDYFKAINDQHGHAVGDAVLKEVARRIRASVRPHDVVTRYGGDEFLVFLANCGTDTATAIANRLLSRVKDAPFEAGTTGLPVSLSIGTKTKIATQVSDIQHFIHAADEALYQAKDAGRGCVRGSFADA